MFKVETFEVLNLPTLLEEKKKGNSRCTPGGKNPSWVEA
jgi:hypothetical protein